MSQSLNINMIHNIQNYQKDLLRAAKKLLVAPNLNDEGNLSNCKFLYKYM